MGRKKPSRVSQDFAKNAAQDFAKEITKELEPAINNLVEAATYAIMRFFYTRKEGFYDKHK